MTSTGTPVIDAALPDPMPTGVDAATTRIATGTTTAVVTHADPPPRGSRSAALPDATATPVTMAAAAPRANAIPADAALPSPALPSPIGISSTAVAAYACTGCPTAAPCWSARTTAPAPWPRKLFGLDANLDGLGDLLVGSTAGFIGLDRYDTATAAFVYVELAASGLDAINDAASGDINNDGKLDFAVIDTRARHLTVYLQQ